MRAADHAARAAVLAANDRHASLVIAVGEGADARWAEAVTLAAHAPVAIVRGALDRPLRTLRVVPPPQTDGVAAGLAAAVPAGARRGAPHDGAAIVDSLQQGDVAVAAVTDWEQLEKLHPPDGAALVLVPDELLPDGATAGLEPAPPSPP